MVGAKISRGLISGWVVDHSAPWSRVEAQLFVERNSLPLRANQSRPDSSTHGVDEGTNGTVTASRCLRCPQAGTRLDHHCMQAAEALGNRLQLVAIQSDFEWMKMQRKHG